MKRNLKFLISFNGSQYFGFQRQPSLPTVQGTIEDTLSQILGVETKINGCSRTDSGVHAKEFCFNACIDNTIPEYGLKKALNSRLPSDIRVFQIDEVPESFHARFDALVKEYLYIIETGETSNVFRSGMTFYYPYKLCFHSLDKAAELFIGEHDFSAFCKAESKAGLKSAVRTVYYCRVEKSVNEIRFYISGNGFLHNMVRIIVGTLIYYSEGKRSLSDIKRAIKTGERSLAGITAPSCGLYLNKVFYGRKEQHKCQEDIMTSLLIGKNKKLKNF
ncbi:MAG: tRNA pseudouridine(38-40) synthase TruA [Eubacterium sp.]|jgi:tRNA pseudouridine38-40 synthase|nr:tRNA pseudouridine(38-40) synthase TruA [Eubacterium sp.]